ncbi:MAG: META domain-containing protein [Pseudomonadota bacterium]
MKLVSTETLYVVLAVLAIVSGGCDRGAAPADSAAAPEWRLESLGETAVLDGTEITLTFGADNSLAGSAGCNRFNAAYRRDGESLYVSALALTRMACPTPGVMAQEQRFVELLEAALRVGEADGRLTIVSETGPTTLTFVRP